MNTHTNGSRPSDPGLERQEGEISNEPNILLLVEG